ncbi:MAG TPA: FAD-dependent monooxygenase [Longimicrobiaceae bacterium]|nr:FAD-dependent monooxygenase [Longimicrobiaceae bacterium]
MHSSVPVVIGSGLTGLSVSHSLSRAGIEHVVIGRRPGTKPRLGESLNLEGTLFLKEMFPQLSRFCFQKKEVRSYLGDYEVLCDFDVSKTLTSKVVYNILGHVPVDSFLQVDRVGFDAALWDLATSAPQCTVVESTVAGLDFDEESDTVTAVRLEDGTVLRPAYVFDASNHGRLLGTAMGQKRRLLGEPQRVAYTHYHLPDGAPHLPEPWDPATVIVRLFPDTDGIDAIAWCIPLGRYVSVGISMAERESDLTERTLLKRAAVAFARYGVEFGSRYTKAVAPTGLKFSYFMYERGAGANWLLAGPSFCQVWWLAGAGVGTALVAARLAPRLLSDPERWGRWYDAYMRQLVPIHDTFDYFALTPRNAFEPEGLQRFSDQFVATNLSRLASAARLEQSPLAALTSPLFSWVFSHPGSVRGYCPIRRLPAGRHEAN